MFAEKTLKIIETYIETAHGGNVSAAAEALGIPPPTLYTWKNQKKSPSLHAIGELVDKITGCKADPENSETMTIRIVTESDELALLRAEIIRLRGENKTLKELIFEAMNLQTREAKPLETRKKETA